MECPSPHQPAPGHSHEDGHSHNDGRPDEGGHTHGGAEVLPEPSGPGTVMLDIGGDRGALIVHTPAHLDGQELEIRPDPGVWVGEHVAVRPRHLPAATIHTAMFDSLPAGRYLVRVRFGPEGAVEVPAEVDGGFVAEVHWPEG